MTKFLRSNKLLNRFIGLIGPRTPHRLSRDVVDRLPDRNSVDEPGEITERTHSVYSPVPVFLGGMTCPNPLLL